MVRGACGGSWRLNAQLRQLLPAIPAWIGQPSKPYLSIGSGGQLMDWQNWLTAKLSILIKVCSIPLLCAVLVAYLAPKMGNSNPTTEVQTHRANSASGFIWSLGVASHIGSVNPTLVLDELSYLGITNVRDGAPPPSALPTFIAVARARNHFVLLESNVYFPDQLGQVNAAADVLRADVLETAAPGSIIGIEGSNEYTSNHYYLNGASSYGNVNWGLTDNAALKAAVRADPLLAGVSVIASSEVTTIAIPPLGELADAGNVHVYGGIGQQLQTRINAWVAAAQASAPGKPVYITETGVSTSGFNTSTWGGGVADPYTQRIIDTNALLDGYKAGAAITFLYELMDEPWASNAQEQNFGLFKSNGTPKPAAIAIGNLTHILADDGTGTIPVGGLAYSLVGLPTSASSILLEKSEGTFDVVLWNGQAKLFDGTQTITPPTSQVTLTLAQAYPQITVFDPLVGRTAIATYSNARQIQVTLSAGPLIIQVGERAATERLNDHLVGAGRPGSRR
jgi:hypothetical protein